MTDILRSHYPTCPPEFGFFPYRVMRAGHIRTTGEYIIERQSVPGTEVIYCLRGTGWVRSRNQQFPVNAGEIAWLDTRHPHAHGPDRRDPWEVYWFRFDGESTEAMQRALGVARTPVFSPSGRFDVEPMFHRLFDEVDHLTMSSAATISSIVGQFIDVFFRIRADDLRSNAATMSISDRLARLHHTVLRTYNQNWDSERMAAELAISTAHMYRVFNSALGMSPNRWLRSIRIEQARRRLVESDDLIGEIAHQVGYRDQFQFSKDFRALTGASPSEFRKRERPKAPSPEAPPES